MPSCVALTQVLLHVPKSPIGVMFTMALESSRTRPSSWSRS